MVFFINIFIKYIYKYFINNTTEPNPSKIDTRMEVKNSCSGWTCWCLHKQTHTHIYTQISVCCKTEIISPDIFTRQWVGQATGGFDFLWCYD